MLGMEEYAKGFLGGMRLNSTPELDLNSMESIGSYDGYIYKEYLEQIGQEELKQEQLIAVIDKYHTQALKRYTGDRDFDKSMGNHR